MRKQHFRKIPVAVVTKEWGFWLSPPGHAPGGDVYVSCNASGKINWEYADVISAERLLTIKDKRIIILTEEEGKFVVLKEIINK
jgi:hypothetical protein